jgi:hypothetical protein
MFVWIALVNGCLEFSEAEQNKSMPEEIQIFVESEDTDLNLCYNTNI